MAHSARPTAPTATGRAGAFAEARRVLTSRGGRWLTAITVVIGVLAAVALIGTATPGDRTFGLVVPPVQALVSVTVPFFSVLLVTDLHDHRTGSIGPRLVAAVALAVGWALFALLVCAVAVAVAPSTAPGRWQHAGMLVLGSVLVQAIAALCGTGLGLLIRRPAVAMISTIVFPLGLYLLLGAVDALDPVQGWVTPFANVNRLLSGQMTALSWLQCLVVIAIWDVGLNVAGALRLRRRS